MPNESLVLDGLDLNTDPFLLKEFRAVPPRQRAEWVTAADSEHGALVRKPLHGDRELVCVLHIDPAGTMDDALDEIAALVDKLDAASDTDDGIELEWTPAGSARTVTFDVLSGEVDELPIDWQSGWLSAAPTITVRMVAKPYWRAAEQTLTAVTSTDPLLTSEIVGIGGDIAALAKVTITDLATQTRQHVEWGLEHDNYVSGSLLLLDSDSLTTTGFAGTGNTRTGAYDPGSAGNSVVRASVSTLPVAVVGTGALTHKGAFRVKARVYAGSASTLWRFAWRVGDGPLTTNSPASAPVVGAFCEVDLGMVTLAGVAAGTHQWRGQVEAYTTTGTDTIDVDYLELIPVDNGYGKIRGNATPATPTAFTLRDEFDTHAVGVLDGLTLPIGGTWAVSASPPAGPFNVMSGGIVTREPSGTGHRFAVAGSTNMTDTDASLDVSAGSATHYAGLLLRYVDTNNWLAVQRDAISVRVLQKVAGVETTLATTGTVFSSGSYARIRARIDASGRFHVWTADPTNTAPTLTASGQDAALATGGALASGKPGLLSTATSASTNSVAFDNFWATSDVVSDAAIFSGQSLRICAEDVLREDSAGTFYGRPGYRRSSRFLLPVGTSRIAVKARRNDVDTLPDTNIADNLQIEIAYSERGLVVPR